MNKSNITGEDLIKSGTGHRSVNMPWKERNNMIYRIQNEIEVPIESYADKLSFLMENYFNMIDEIESEFSEKATKKAKKILKWIIYPNKKDFKNEYKDMKKHSKRKTLTIIKDYTKCIMQLLGRIAECIIVDRCSSNPNINMMCINIAMFKPDIYKKYPDIPYSDYVAFSTSFKYIFFKKNGVYVKCNVPGYNPNHTSKDIAWFNKENILDQLKVNIPEVSYLDNAKLQIKASLDSSKLNLDDYYLTPVICFDLCNNIEKLKLKYPDNILFSVDEISPEMETEIEMYFRILAAYAIGLIDHINLTDIEVQEDLELDELFIKPIKDIYEENKLNIMGIIEKIKKIEKPIIINT